jgi:hypothetical protein
MSDSEDTVELIEIDYYGKDYVVDNQTKEVYEKVGEGYQVIGRLTKAEPIEIKFLNKPDWTEEYEDIEPQVYKGVEYMINPKTHNVFLLNVEIGDYEYVGHIVSIKPLEIHLEVDDDEVELEVIESGGKKYIKDVKNNVYDGKKFELIGTWNSIDNVIDFIPSRGFLNINNSCFIDSVLFALLYRSSKFIDKHILRKDMDSTKISNPDVVRALKKNQSELLRLYKWLHNIDQPENTDKVCTPFRKAYSQVGLNSVHHNSSFENKMGDSSEFLFTIFNGFNVKTLIKESVSYGKNRDELVEINRLRERVAPIILISSKETSTNYFNQKEISNSPFNVVLDMSQTDSELFNTLETIIMIEKIKILLGYLQKKTRISKKEKDRMRDRIAIDINSLTELDHKEIKDIYVEIKKILNVKETREVEKLYEDSVDLNVLVIRLGELKQSYKKEYLQKIDETVYSGISDYIVLSIDRTLGGARELKRDTTAFNIQETIETPIGTKLGLEFVVSYTESPKHYVCYFKGIDDDQWYLYNDVSKGLRLVGKGTFECMKYAASISCTLLFYSK